MKQQDWSWYYIVMLDKTQLSKYTLYWIIVSIPRHRLHYWSLVWISNFIIPIVMDTITYPCWYKSWSMLVKGVQVFMTLFIRTYVQEGMSCHCGEETTLSGLIISGKRDTIHSTESTHEERKCIRNWHNVLGSWCCYMSKLKCYLVCC